jgi:hypothetical protein
MSDTTLDPRIEAFIRSRGKLAPVGVRCVVTPVQGGRYYVQAAQPAESGVFEDGEYFGNAPFQVTRNPRGRDIIKCTPSEEIIDTRPLPLRYFYFALRADWSYVDTDTPANNVDTVDAYPFWLGSLGTIPAPVEWKGFSGKVTTIDPPDVAANPYKVAAISDSTVVSFLPYNGGTSTVHTLNTLYFYRASLTAPYADETTFVSGTFPNNTATPTTAGSVLTDGNWQVKFDVYELVNSTTETFLETKTIGLLNVPGSAISTDYTTWATANPAYQWTSQEVAGDVIEYRIKNLRIEQVT